MKTFFIQLAVQSVLLLGAGSLALGQNAEIPTYVDLSELGQFDALGNPVPVGERTLEPRMDLKQDFVTLSAEISNRYPCLNVKLQFQVAKDSGNFRAANSYWTEAAPLCMKGSRLGRECSESRTMSVKVPLLPDSNYKWRVRARVQTYSLRRNPNTKTWRCEKPSKRFHKQPWANTDGGRFISFGTFPIRNQAYSQIGDIAAPCGSREDKHDGSQFAYPPDGKWGTFVSTPERPGCGKNIRLGWAQTIDDKYRARNGRLLAKISSQKACNLTVYTTAASKQAEKTVLAERQLKPNEAFSLEQRIGPIKSNGQAEDLVTFVHRSTQSHSSGTVPIFVECASDEQNKLEIDSLVISYDKQPGEVAPQQ